MSATALRGPCPYSQRWMLNNPVRRILQPLEKTLDAIGLPVGGRVLELGSAPATSASTRRDASAPMADSSAWTCSRRWRATCGGVSMKKGVT